jgi:hypothetical protein
MNILRDKWPRRRRAAEQRDELAPGHSITSSARASRLSGTVRPSAFAVLRLITSSYLVGACTGRLAGFSPLRMRSTYCGKSRGLAIAPLRPAHVLEFTSVQLAVHKQRDLNLPGQRRRTGVLQE